MVCHIRLAGLAIAALLMPSIVAAQAPPPTKAPVAPKIDQLDPNACARSDTQTTVGKGGEVQVHPRHRGSSAADPRNRRNAASGKY